MYSPPPDLGSPVRRKKHARRPKMRIRQKREVAGLKCGGPRSAAGRAPDHCTQSLDAFAASQSFVSVPNGDSCVSALSLNIGGLQALSVTQAVQLAPLPLMR